MKIGMLLAQMRHSGLTDSKEVADLKLQILSASTDKSGVGRFRFIVEPLIKLMGVYTGVSRSSLLDLGSSSDDN